MALIWSVYWPTADMRGPDLDAMNRIIEVPDEVARMRINDGTARFPTADEVAAYQETQEVEQKAAAVEDLTMLPKVDLERMAAEREIEVPPKATKADLASAIEKHDKEQAEATPAEAP